MRTFVNFPLNGPRFHGPHFFGLLGKELVYDAVTNRATGVDGVARHADNALACGRERR
jgi:hypothetical protein